MKDSFIFQWIKAIIVLPGTVFVFIPSILLYLFRDKYVFWDTSGPKFFIAFFLLLIGLFFALWTMSLFFRFGNGTPAPWNPPKEFVVKGPYCYVRNPMMIGGFCILLSESLFFESLAIFILFLFFVLVNLIYIPTFEEPGLEKRFGAKYLEYKKHVPRWIPKLTPFLSLTN